MDSVTGMDPTASPLAVQPPPPREAAATPPEETREVATDSETGHEVDTYA